MPGGFPGGMNFNMGGGMPGGMGGAAFDPNEIFKMFFSQGMDDDGGFGSFMNAGGRSTRGGAQGFPGGGMGGMGGMGGFPGFNMGSAKKGGGRGRGGPAF